MLPLICQGVTSQQLTVDALANMVYQQKDEYCSCRWFDRNLARQYGISNEMLQSVMDMPHSQAQSMEQVGCRVLKTRCAWVIVQACVPAATDPAVANVCQLRFHIRSSVFGCIAVGDTRQVVRGVEGVPAAGRAA
jgi:hypothetical protein